MRGLIRYLAIVVLFLGAFASASTQSRAQTGEVRLNIVKAGFIVGIGGGSGVLHYNGHAYRLSIGGVGVGSLG
ncbi:MAG: hypothetical protein WA829_17590, partial [Candidatus Acidiferrum sp.]